MIGSEWFEARPGGLNRYFDGLARAMADEADVDLSAWAFGAAPSYGRSVGPLGMSLVERVRRTAKLAGASDADIIDCHFALYGQSTIVRQPPRVVHFHGPWAEESAVSSERRQVVALKRLVERRAYRGADAFVTLSEAFKAVVIEKFQVDPARVSVIPPGVDIDRFQPSFAAPTAPRALCVRRLERRMGIDVLLRAWREVVTNVPDAQLHVVGSGTFEQALRSLASELGLDHSVFFLGRISDEELASAYACATFSVVPTVALEGFGLISLESMASGCPAIVTDCGGLPDAVRPLDESLVVEAGSEEALAVRMLQAFAGQLPSRRACRAHAESYSWRSVATRHVDLYRELEAMR
ncbi:glycosyltransferase family 4 protein [Demequina mangrovi]|uniref:Glycosyltransferase involved in cell wall bisynthesis n=1 Tax=Demequina mangrovi TaxID=1043493 RepID=A0A1H6YSP4_9MICO|nr:glycosyltransferase family 4 protein [Demequina mangrovi]SEJ40292.1 Glycosyltransferase involved in cell wall bisynthesis [Demequina mangrovi]